jgi:hypothetical protein
MQDLLPVQIIVSFSCGLLCAGACVALTKSTLWHRYRNKRASARLSTDQLPKLLPRAELEPMVAKWRDAVLQRIADPITEHSRKQVLRFSRDQAQSAPSVERLIQLGYNWSILTSLATNNFQFASKAERDMGKRFFWDAFALCAQQGAWDTFATMMEYRCQQLGLTTNRTLHKLHDL